MLDARCASDSSSPAASIGPAGSASRRACSGSSSASRGATTCTCSSFTIIPNRAVIRCSAPPCMISDASTVCPASVADGSAAGCRPRIDAQGPFDRAARLSGHAGDRRRRRSRGGTASRRRHARQRRADVASTTSPTACSVAGSIARALASAIRAAARVTVSTNFMARMMPDGLQRRAGGGRPDRRRSRAFPPSGRPTGRRGGSCASPASTG